MLVSSKDHHRSDGTDRAIRRVRPGTALSAAVAGAIVAGAAAVALLGGQPETTRSAGISPSVPAPSPVLEAATSPTIALVASEPLLVAPEVTWHVFSGVPLPYSEAGPRSVDGPVFAGYERSPTGALLAAAHLGTRSLLTPGSGWLGVVEAQVLPGPGRDAFVAVREEVDKLDPPGTYGQPAGFRFVAFTPDVAVLQEVSRFSLTGRLQVTTTTLRWVDGDWRLELQPDGSASPTAQSVQDLDGFVVWGP